MKIKQFDPIGEHSWGSSSSLDDYDLKYFPIDTEVILYWYVRGRYEGSGETIYRVKGLWYYASLNHCSCYGPTENLSTDNGKELNILLSEFSEELKERVKHFRFK